MSLFLFFVLWGRIQIQWAKNYNNSMQLKKIDATGREGHGTKAAEMNQSQNIVEPLTTFRSCNKTL